MFSLAGTQSYRQADPRITRAIGIMEGTLSSPPSAAGLARSVGLSPSRFAHLFKTHTNSTPAAVLKRLRVARAAELLRTTCLALKEIGAETGFEHSSAFTRAFRAASGMSPGEFRKSQRPGLAGQQESSNK